MHGLSAAAPRQGWGTRKLLGPLQVSSPSISGRAEVELQHRGAQPAPAHSPSLGSGTAHPFLGGSRGLSPFGGLRGSLGCPAAPEGRAQCALTAHPAAFCNKLHTPLESLRTECRTPCRSGQGLGARGSGWLWFSHTLRLMRGDREGGVGITEGVM